VADVFRVHEPLSLSSMLGVVVASRLVQATMSKSPVETVGIVIVNEVVGLPVGTALATKVTSAMGSGPAQKPLACLHHALLDLLRVSHTVAIALEHSLAHGPLDGLGQHTA
jgi:hypothetical protein